jgi:hypothetical protein
MPGFPVENLDFTLGLFPGSISHCVEEEEEEEEGQGQYGQCQQSKYDQGQYGQIRSMSILSNTDKVNEVLRPNARFSDRKP